MVEHRDQPAFAVRQHDEDDAVVLSVTGELDLETAPLLRHRIHDTIAEGGRRVIIDMADLDFIDSTGISVLVDGLRQAQRLGGSLVLRRPTRATERVLEITGLLGLFGLGG